MSKKRRKPTKSTSTEHKIVIAPDGKVTMIYDDALLGLMQDLGDPEVRRASHVEPDGFGWGADMKPVKGPKLGPFNTRKEALDAERGWLLEHGVPTPA